MPARPAPFPVMAIHLSARKGEAVSLSVDGNRKRSAGNGAGLVGLSVLKLSPSPYKIKK